MIFVRSLVAAGAWALLSCVGVRSLDRNGAWNENGVWRPVNGMAGAYVPRDMPARPRLVAESGEWVEDPQDGFRFFVPHEGTKAYSSELLRGEAKKATNKFSMGRQWTHNSLEVVRVPLFMVTAGLIHPRSWDYSSSSSEGTIDDDDYVTTDTFGETESEPEPAARPRGISPSEIATPPPPLPVKEPEVVTRPERP